VILEGYAKYILHIIKTYKNAKIIKQNNKQNFIFFDIKKLIN
jgi:hypothetical protein